MLSEADELQRVLDITSQLTKEDEERKRFDEQLRREYIIESKLEESKAILRAELYAEYQKNLNNKESMHQLLLLLLSSLWWLLLWLLLLLFAVSMSFFWLVVRIV